MRIAIPGSRLYRPRAATAELWGLSVHHSSFSGRLLISALRHRGALSQYRGSELPVLTLDLPAQPPTAASRGLLQALVDVGDQRSPAAPSVRTAVQSAMVAAFAEHFRQLSHEDLLETALAIVRWTPEATLATICGKGIVAEALRNVTQEGGEEEGGGER